MLALKTMHNSRELSDKQAHNTTTSHKMDRQTDRVGQHC